MFHGQNIKLSTRKMFLPFSETCLALRQKKTGISCKTSTLPSIGQRRKAAEKSSAVKEHRTSFPVLQNNQLGTWSELGGSIDLLSSHSTVTRLQKREHSIRSDGKGRSTVLR